MKIFRSSPQKEDELVSGSVFCAQSFFTRLSGLIFRRPLGSGEALLLKDCKSIHTLGMRYSIDAVFIDREGRIISLFEGIPPWRFLPHISKASAVMEFRSGFIKKKKLRTGDVIVLR